MEACAVQPQAKERVEVDGVFLGHVEPYFRGGSWHRPASKRPTFFAYLPNGLRTEFTLPSRRQAIEWLKGAAR